MKKLNSQRLRYALLIALLLLSVVLYAWYFQPHNSNVPAKVIYKGCGIAKTGTGYAFSWLHVEKGYIMSDKHCIVDLKGFNLAGTEFGNGVGGFGTPVSERLVAWFNATFRMDVWRVPLNAYWWNHDVYVPAAHMSYRTWIQQMVRWFEHYGDYVILTYVSHFHNLPCSVDSQCPSQDQAERNLASNPNDLNAQADWDNAFAAGIGMWTDIATLYANDPAVLYDGLNEICCMSARMWQYKEDIVTATIRAHNPRSLVFLANPDWNSNINPIILGELPNFTQPNLVYDFHVYNGYKAGPSCQEPLSYLWQNWPLYANQQVTFAQQHNDAVAFNEWGGCADFAEYNQAITSYARYHHICLAYYEKDDVVSAGGNAYRLTANGLRVQRAYALW